MIIAAIAALIIKKRKEVFRNKVYFRLSFVCLSPITFASEAITLPFPPILTPHNNGIKLNVFSKTEAGTLLMTWEIKIAYIN